MVKTLPRHAENENEKMVPAPTTAWLQHGSAGPIFHGQHRTAEHPDSRYAGDRYFYGGRQLSSERHDTSTLEIISLTSHSYPSWN